MANDQQVGIGTTANDGTGDPLRTAFTKYNDHLHPAADISDSTAAGRTLLTALDAAAQRTALNVENGADVTDAANVDAAGAVMHTDIAEADGFLLKTGAEVYEAVKINRAATVAPAVTDDSAAGYSVGSSWFDTTADKAYACLDATAGAAVWIETTAGAAGGVTSVGATDVVTVGDGATISEASHSQLAVDGTALDVRIVRLRHATTLSSPVTVTVDDGLTKGVTFVVASDQTGLVTIQRQTSATINGGTSAELTEAGAIASLMVPASNTYLLAGDVRGASALWGTMDAQGEQITNSVQPLADDEETASFTLALAHGQQKMVRCNHATTAIVVTVPTDAAVAFPLGTVINLNQWGAAAVTVAGDTGVTVNKPSDRTLGVRAQYEVVSLWKQAADTWLAFGGLAST